LYSRSACIYDRQLPSKKSANFMFFSSFLNAFFIAHRRLGVPTKFATAGWVDSSAAVQVGEQCGHRIATDSSAQVCCLSRE